MEEFLLINEQSPSGDIPPQNKLGNHKLIIGILAGIIIGIIIIVSSSLLYTKFNSASKHVSEFNELENKWTDLDTRFFNEQKNMYPANATSESGINDSILSTQKTRDLLLEIKPIVGELVNISYTNSQSGDTKDYFLDANKCYTIRQEVYD